MSMESGAGAMDARHQKLQTLKGKFAGLDLEKQSKIFNALLPEESGKALLEWQEYQNKASHDDFYNSHNWPGSPEKCAAKIISGEFDTQLIEKLDRLEEMLG